MVAFEFWGDVPHQRLRVRADYLGDVSKRAVAQQRFTDQGFQVGIPLGLGPLIQGGGLGGLPQTEMVDQPQPRAPLPQRALRHFQRPGYRGPGLTLRPKAADEIIERLPELGLDLSDPGRAGSLSSKPSQPQ
jgi:hypothetical protein